MVTPAQIRKLGTYALSRNGDVVPGAGAMTPGACWNFALTGTVTMGSHPTSPESLIARLLNVNPFVIPNVCLGMQATATIGNFPGCAPELAILHAQHLAAINDDAAAKAACMMAVARIIVIMNGLVPLAPGGNDRYQLHMQTHEWFGWDHWALSMRAEQPGRPRIFVQTVTGKLLKHACTTIWDEGLDGVTIELQGFHATQTAFINLVADYGPLCVTCGTQHWYTPSNPFNAWHRCGTCGVTYCPTHGALLGGGRGWGDRTRTCGYLGCAGRTALRTYVWPF